LIPPDELIEPTEVSLSNAQLAFIEQRRSTRIDRAIPITVHGANLSQEPYQELVSTLAVSYHGCRYRTRYELVPGDVVYLEVNQPDAGASAATSRARVRWLNALATGEEPVFEVAVELEPPGNIWGVASPPQDWSLTRRPEPSGPRRAMRVAETSENQMASLGLLMAGLGEQIQMMASEAATAVIVADKNRVLDEFRAQLRREAYSTLESVIATSKKELTLQALADLKEMQEAEARGICETWLAKIARDTECAALSITAHGSEVSQRVESMAVHTIERLQDSMNESRTAAVDQCLIRLRGQLVPLLEEVQTARDHLAACQDNLKVKSLAICNQFEDFLQGEAGRTTTEMQERLAAFVKQFDDSASERMTVAEIELGAKSAGIIDSRAQALQKLSQECELSTHGRLEALVQSAGEQISDLLARKTAEISEQCSAELEGYTRSHLAFISESIAEIAKKKANRGSE
jgi:hypothetical protein